MMKKNICKQSETFRRTYTFRDAQTKAVTDLTGCIAFSQIRDKPGGELVAEADCDINIAEGRVTLLWTSEKTANIAPGTYYFDAWLKCGDDQRPFTTEEIDIVPSITEIVE